jgi:hypothetical protein
MFDPVTKQMFEMIRGYRVSQIVGTLAELQIPDRLADGALAYDELAKEIGCEPQATYRLLRASASVGVIAAMNDGRFCLTPLGEKLRSNVPGSMRDIAVAVTAPGHWLPWGHLADAIRSGQRQAQDVLATCRLWICLCSSCCPDAREPLGNTASYATRPVFASIVSLRQRRRCTLSRPRSCHPEPGEVPYYRSWGTARKRRNFLSGSIASFPRCPRYVFCAPTNGLKSARPTGFLRANNGHRQPCSITFLARS